MLDDAKQYIHKLAVPDDQDEAKVKDLYIKERDGKLKILAKDSAIIRRIPKSVRTVQIVADAEGEVLEEVRREATRFEESAS